MISYALVKVSWVTVQVMMVMCDCRVKKLACLIILDVASNPVSSTVSHFRLFTIYHLKNLKALDGYTIVSNISMIIDVIGEKFVFIC